MCGIFTLLNHNGSKLESNDIYESFMKGKKRGPDHSVVDNVSINAIFGFHRLAINGLNMRSNQPMYLGNLCLICNGEIYNYKEIYSILNIEPLTDSDCEVILHCYKKFGIEYTLELLDGVFSFLLLDNDPKTTKLFVARDPFGVRPLYIMTPTTDVHTIGFSSEMKSLINLCDTTQKIQHFPPGSYSQYVLPNHVNPYWSIETKNIKYFNKAFTSVYQMKHNILEEYSMNDILKSIKNHLTNAVYKRCATTDRPIACLLSGGLDSSLITALVCSYFPDKQIETYAIGLQGSVDLLHATKAAEYLKTKHTNITITKEEYLNAIPEVIYAIESYDTTTVRASVGNYLVSKYISEHSDAKVIFNGDGSDELFGGYLYVNAAPNCLEFDNECRSLLTNIHKYDVLRSDKSISSNGLEARTPFLDRSFTQYILSLPPQLRFQTGELDLFTRWKYVEKFLLRAAFDDTMYVNYNPENITEQILPEEILWRSKEAFSDGVCDVSENINTIIENHVKTLEIELRTYDINNPQTLEQEYYRSIFEEHYKDQGHIIEHFWMPKFLEAKDPSARTLSIYREFESLEKSL